MLIVGLGAAGLYLRVRLAGPSWHASSTETFAGDTWDGNLVSDGRRIVLLSREDIQGFWGQMTVRASEDGGATWDAPTYISAIRPNAARHALVAGPAGSLWAAWAEQGPRFATQRLVLRRSLDGGATWTAPVGLSPSSVGLVGIPALVATDLVRLVAVTDGTTGDIYVQRLDGAGSPHGDPVIVGRTTRELYSNAQFYDGGLSIGAVDGHVVLLYHDGSDARALVSADGGRTWTEAWREAGSTLPPRLATQGGRFIALQTRTTGSDGEVWAVASDDGGATWSRVGRWGGGPVFAITLTATQSGGLAGWATCRDTRCTERELRVADVANGLRDPIRVDLAARTRPVGLAIAGGSMVVAYAREDPSGIAEVRRLDVATGPKP